LPVAGNEVDVEAVAAGAARDAGGLDAALLGEFLPIVVEVSVSGRRLRRAELAGCRERGSEAAAAGVALRALIDLYLSAAWRLWRELPAVNDGTAEQVRVAGLAVLRAADDGVAAVASGYQVARNDLARRQESARREVFDALLAGGSEALAVLGRTAELGVDIAAPHAAFVVDGDFDTVAAAALPGRLERALQGMYGDDGVLVAVKAGRLVCIVAAPDTEAVTSVSQQLRSVLDDHGLTGWRAAAGRAGTGPDGVRSSYDQALEALDLAERLGMPGPVVNSDELVIYRVLLRDREALDELIRVRLGPLLLSARGSTPALLETLDVYFATGANTTETARRLHLSVRAVTYRLARVQSLLGVDPKGPAERYALQTAVLGARAAGWPS
jgi:PucR C-terminal helix-turn-helix domain/GGDEF-like domain